MKAGRRVMVMLGSKTTVMMMTEVRAMKASTRTCKSRLSVKTTGVRVMRNQKKLQEAPR